MSSLNCVKNQVPSSLSLQSVGVRPAEYEPGLAALTVRAGRGAAGRVLSGQRLELSMVGRIFTRQLKLQLKNVLDPEEVQMMNQIIWATGLFAWTTH